MNALTNILTIACLATAGGILANKPTLAWEDAPERKVRAFLHGATDDVVAKPVVTTAAAPSDFSTRSRAPLPGAQLSKRAMARVA